MQILRESKFVLNYVLSINAGIAACSGGPSPNLDRIDACNDQSLKVGSALLLSTKEAFSEDYCVQIIDQDRCLYRKMGSHPPFGIQNIDCKLNEGKSIELEIAGEVLLFEKEGQGCSGKIQWTAGAWTMLPGDMPCFETGGSDEGGIISTVDLTPNMPD